MGEPFTTACSHIEARLTGPLVADRGSNLLLPLPQLVPSAAPKRGSCGGKKRNAAQRLLSGWVSGTPKGTHFTRGKVLELDGLLIAAEYPGLKAYLKIGDPGMV